MEFNKYDGPAETETHHAGIPLNGDCERCGSSGRWLRQPISYRGDAEAYHGYEPGDLCRGCHMDLLPDPQVLYTDLLDNSFKFYFGAASGSSRKALRKAEESHVMVSYATENNGRIGPEERHFVDSGGAPQTFTQGDFADTGDYTTSDEEYISYVEDVDADLWSLRDYPCEDQVLDTHDRTVADHQQMTTDRHRSLLNKAERRGIKGQPVSIVQGQSIDEYLSHIDQLREAGVLTDYVGIGSICNRCKVQQTANIIKAVRDALPSRHAIHAFGVKKTILEKTNALEHLSSADSCAYDYGLRMESQYGDERYFWKSVLREYLDYKTEIGRIITRDEQTDDNQATWDQYQDTSSPIPAR